MRVCDGNSWLFDFCILRRYTSSKMNMEGGRRVKRIVLGRYMLMTKAACYDTWWTEFRCNKLISTGNISFSDMTKLHLTDLMSGCVTLKQDEHVHDILVLITYTSREGSDEMLQCPVYGRSGTLIPNFRLMARRLHFVAAYLC